MTKAQIENVGLSGIRSLDLEDIATISKNGRVVTLRHNWSEDTDGRVWDSIRRALKDGAQALASRIGKSVETYAKGGYVMDEYEPKAWSPREINEFLRAQRINVSSFWEEAAGGDTMPMDRQDIDHVLELMLKE